LYTDNNGNPYEFEYKNLDPDPFGIGKWIPIDEEIIYKRVA